MDSQGNGSRSRPLNCHRSRRAEIADAECLATEGRAEMVKDDKVAATCAFLRFDGGHAVALPTLRTAN